MTSVETSSQASAAAPADITRAAKSNFSLSFAFLNAEQRVAMQAIYAFCRAVDDAVDDAEDLESGEARLAFWMAELEAASLGAHDSVQTATGRALALAMPRFGIPQQHLAAVAEGCASDLRGDVSFATLEELEGYCAKVASAVGLACLPVFGASEESCGFYADRLGKALQLTNILRDLRTDAEVGRCYAPLDMLAAAGVEREWLLGSGPTEVYRDGGPVHQLVESLATFAHRRFDEALAAMPADPAERRKLVTAEIMGAIYYRLLELVEVRAGRLDVPGRLRVTKPGKVRLALRTWWRGGRVRWTP